MIPVLRVFIFTFTFVFVLGLSGCTARIDTAYPEDGKGPKQKFFLIHEWSIQ